MKWKVSWGSETVTKPNFRIFKHLSNGLTLVLQSLPKCFIMGERENHAQVGKLLTSHTLHGSESLCKLLSYLAQYALAHPGSSPKEYQIATEVFGRPEGFDPHQDSMVRVQVGRLRAKLAEYYVSEGVRDPIVIELPKGTYALTYQEGQPPTHHEEGAIPGGRASGPVSQVPSPIRWIAAIVVFSMVLAAAVAVSIDRLFFRGVAQAHPLLEVPAVPASISTFWNGFITGHEPPWVIFSNAAFVGRPDTGMRYYDAKRDANQFTLDHYTGVGEVLAVHSLDAVFRQLQQDLRVKRGRLFSLDDAKNNDLIFLGSPSENLTLLEIPTTRDFSFKRLRCCSREGNIEIVNAHPGSGESTEYRASPSNQPLTEDYAVIAMVKGLEGTHSVLILAGTTTIGTQAAVEYVCNQNSLDELLRALGVSSPADLKPFEAVIRAKVVRGVPVSSELVAFHKMSS